MVLCSLQPLLGCNHQLVSVIWFVELFEDMINRACHPGLSVNNVYNVCVLLLPSIY